MARISNRFSFYIACGRVISMLAGFIMPVVLVRIMSQEDYGLVSQFLTLYTSVYTIAALGIHTNMFFFCHASKKETIDKYVTNTLFLLSLFGVLCGVLLFMPPISKLIFGNSELGQHSDLITLSVSMAVVMNVISPLNTIRQDKLGALFYPGIIAFGRIGTIVYAAVMFNDVHQMFFWMFIFQCIISISIIFYTFHGTKFSLDFSLMKNQLMYSLPFGIAVALQITSNYFDKFVCIRMLTPTEYAIYGIAFLSIPGITQIYDSLCQVNIVNMSNSFRNNEIEEILPQYGNFVKKTLSFSVPVILVVSLYAEEIMSFLYTSSYKNAAPFFRLYSLTFLTSMLGAGTILRSMGKTKMSMIAFLMTCAVGMPTTYFLVARYGTTGAIIGAVLNIVLPRIIQMAFEIYVTNSKIISFLPWKQIGVILLCSIMLIIPLFIVKILFHLNLFCCIIEGLLYVSIVYFILIKMDLFTISRDTVVNICKKMQRKFNGNK